MYHQTHIERTVDLSGMPGEKVIGLLWNPLEDEISFGREFKCTPEQTDNVYQPCAKDESNWHELQKQLFKKKGS